MSYIVENLERVNKKITDTCAKVGRDPKSIKLIAVTKTVESDVMCEAIASGVDAIGENRVQEIIRKYDDVPKGVEWHLIGHLQTNKVKYIIDKVDLIHSVDSLKLAKEINKNAQKYDKIMNILVQVNVADEDSKFGIQIDEVDAFVDAMSEYAYVKVLGLMTIAPYDENPEQVRVYFKTLKQKFDQLKAEEKTYIDMQYLSMGMTNDYHVAIEEGANMLRVGTGIFGKRQYI